MDNLIAIAPQVGQHLHGAPTVVDQRKAIMRWSRSGKSDSGSIQLDLTTGVFRDWANQVGGGVLKWLVLEGEAIDTESAWKWLKANGFVRDDGMPVKVAPPVQAKRAAPKTDDERGQVVIEFARNALTMDDANAAPARTWLASKIPTWKARCAPDSMAYIPGHRPALASVFGSGWTAQDGFEGAVVFGLRTIDEWMKRNRGIARPEISAVQCIGIASDGAQVNDNKRSLGQLRGRVYMLDCDGILADVTLDARAISVGLCEGIADAISIVSMYGIPAIATIGTPSANAPYIGDLARFGGVDIYADSDTHGRGQEMAGGVMRALNAKRGDGYARLLCMADGYGKDPADCAAILAIDAMDDLAGLQSARERILAGGDAAQARRLLKRASDIGYDYDRSRGEFTPRGGLHGRQGID